MPKRVCDTYMVQIPMFRIVIIIGMLGLASSAIAAIETAVHAILQDPDSFNQSEVLVEGKATHVQMKASRQGNPYTLFSLTDPGTHAQIKVFSRGHKSVTESSNVIVHGIYYKILHRGGYTFHNEIDAITIRPQRDGPH